MGVPHARPLTLGAGVAFLSLAATRLAAAAFDTDLAIGASLAIAGVAGLVATVVGTVNVAAARRSGELRAAPEVIGPEPLFHELVAGGLHLDLTGARLASAPAIVHANLRVGEIEVLVPDDLVVEVHTRGLIGEAVVFGASSRGLRPRRDLVTDLEPDLVLHLMVTIGEIRVVQRPAGGARLALHSSGAGAGPPPGDPDATEGGPTP